MFCSSPFGSAPEVTGPYCSQTRSGALPPDAWLCTAAFAVVMLALFSGSHCTVTFLCAASYSRVSFFIPALAAASIVPVLGGSTALMTIAPPLLEPLDEQPAASPPASSSAAAAAIGLLMGIFCIRSHLLVRVSVCNRGSCGPGWLRGGAWPEQPQGDEGEREHDHEEQGADGHAVAVLVVLERGLVHVEAGHQGRRAGAAVGQQQDRDEVLHRVDPGQDDHDAELGQQQRDVDGEHPLERADAVHDGGVEHILRQVLQPAEEDQEAQVGDPREADQQD